MRFIYVDKVYETRKNKAKLSRLLSRWKNHQLVLFTVNINLSKGSGDSKTYEAAVYRLNDRSKELCFAH